MYCPAPVSNFLPSNLPVTYDIRVWEIYRIIWVTGYRRHMGCRRNSFRWRDQTLTAYVLSRLLASRHGREGALDRDAAAGHLLGNEMLGFQLLVLRLARDGDPPAQPLSGYCSLSVYLHSALPSSLVGYCYILLYRGVSVNSSSLSSWGLLCPCASYALCWMPCCFFFIWGHYINRIKAQWVTGWSKKVRPLRFISDIIDLNVHDFFRCSFEKVRRGHGYKLFYPYDTHLPVLISSHTEYCVSGMYCHMTLILVHLQVSNILLAQTFCKNF